MQLFTHFYWLKTAWTTIWGFVFSIPDTIIGTSEVQDYCWSSSNNISPRGFFTVRIYQLHVSMSHPSVEQGTASKRSEAIWTSSVTWFEELLFKWSDHFSYWVVMLHLSFATGHWEELHTQTYYTCSYTSDTSLTHFDAFFCTLAINPSG